MAQSLGEQLLLEIKRVRGLQQQYLSMRGMPGVNVEPVILLMEHAINSAITASVEGDLAGMIAAYSQLKDFTE